MQGKGRLEKRRFKRHTRASGRVGVNNVAWLAKQGLTPQQVLEHYPDLMLAQVHAALAYYYDNRDEIEAELAAENQAADDFERRKAELIAKRSGR